MAANTTSITTTETQVTVMEQLLKKNNLLTAQDSLEEREKYWRASTAAHRTRLSEAYLKLAQDPQFIKSFPEFKPLFINPQLVVKELLTHDEEKTAKKIKNAIRMLSLLQGYDYRNPNKGVPSQVDFWIRKFLKNAIDEINFVGKNLAAERHKQLSQNPNWKKLHSILTDALDLNDTYMFRQDEIAKDGRSLLSPSEWIEKLEADGAYSSEDLKNNDLKKRLAKFLETTKTLKDPSKFTQAKDVLTQVKSADYISDINMTFASNSQHLLADAKAIKFSEIPELAYAALKKAPMKLAILGPGVFYKVIKKTPIALGGITAVDYLIEPENVSLTKAAYEFASLPTISDKKGLPKCDSVVCNQFMQQCVKQINEPNKRYDDVEIMKNSKFSECIDHFFNLPLAEQSKTRSSDNNLNQILMKYSPLIYNISCKVTPDQLSVELGTFSETTNITSQNLKYSMSGQLKKITHSDNETLANDQVIYSNSDMNFMQHCKDKYNCKIYDRGVVLDEKLYFWKNDKSKILSDKKSEKFPADSFIWARQINQVTRKNQDKIFECCQNSECQNYFKDSNKKLQNSELIKNAQKYKIQTITLAN